MTTNPNASYGLNSPELVRDLEVALGMATGEADPLAEKLRAAIAGEAKKKTTQCGHCAHDHEHH